MKYYLGENFSKSFYLEELKKTGGTGQVLFSFASASSIEKALQILEYMSPEAEFIIDSGAFSAWNSGKEIDREELLKFYKAIRAKFPNAHFINLDKIPGERGRKPTREEAREACEISWENYLWFKKNGIVTLPVFHENDDFTFLYRMMKDTDYIAISPANDSSTKRRMVWLDKVFKILKADYKTHGLAATSHALLKKYPFYSVDSINWKAPVLYGGNSSRIKGIDKDKISILVRKKGYREIMMRKEIETYVQLQDKITKLWKMRGVDWDKWEKKRNSKQ